MKWITRDVVRANRHKIFLFGDNILMKGYGGQAKEMRNEWNTLGIPTKWLPRMNIQAFFTDDDFDLIKQKIDHVLKGLRQSSFQIVVIPANGIGTGLARLDKTAPKIFKYLQEQLEKLEDDNV